MALGVLKYTPDQFRDMTLGEFILAMDGVAMEKGTYKSGVTWDEVLEAGATWQRQQSQN
jgi:hypothetical protein